MLLTTMFNIWHARVFIIYLAIAPGIMIGDHILIEAIRFKVKQRMEGARKDRHGTKKILGQCTNDKVATEFALFNNQTQ